MNRKDNTYRQKESEIKWAGQGKEGEEGMEERTREKRLQMPYDVYAMEQIDGNKEFR